MSGISLVYPRPVWIPHTLGSGAFNLNQCVASGQVVLRSYFIASVMRNCSSLKRLRNTSHV